MTNKIRGIINQIKWKYNTLAYNVIRKISYYVPIHQRRILFINESFSCNPKYIALEMLRRGKNMELWWLSDYDLKEVPPQIQICKRNSKRAIYLLSTAASIIINSKGANIDFKKRESQFIVQTWHGSFPLKYIEKEAEEMLPRWYVENSKKDSEMTDLIISNYPKMTEIFRNSFWYDGEVYECGLPRDDIYFSKDDLNERIREKIGVNLNTKIILYAPTFRDDGDIDCYNLDCEEVIDILSKKTGEKWIMLVRLHPNAIGSKIGIKYGENVIDVNSYVDVQELNYISNLLITDYSSIMFDFMIQSKPIILYTPDEEEYLKKCRGVRGEYFSLPFKKIHNNSELEKQFDALDLNNAYPRSYYSKLKNIDDGFASARVVDKILKEIEKRKQ